MQYARFSALNRDISRIGFGTFGFAGVFEHASETEMVDSLLYSLDRGVNFIDTARAYTGAERIVAKALHQWNGTPPVIASKVPNAGTSGDEWFFPKKVEEVFPRHHITASIDASLADLELDSIDLMQLHLYWPNWGTEGYWMDELIAAKEAGKIKAIGISNPDQRCDIALPLVLSGKIDSVQTVFNIFDPTPLDCLIPIAQQNDVAIIARCVLDEGGLTGFLKPDTQFAESDYRKSFFGAVPRESYIERVESLRSFLPENASSLAALALKFALKHSGVTSAISSMHIQRYADENISAADDESLSDSVFKELRYYHRWIRNFYDTKIPANLAQTR